MENNYKIAAIDADNAGRQAGQAVLADDEEKLHEISSRINIGAEIVTQWAEKNGGSKISAGGDEAVIKIPADAISGIEQLRQDYYYATNLTITVGIGSTLSEAGKALIVGKFRGKNTSVQYDPSIEDEITQARQRLEEGTASAEEQKLGEAYLRPETKEAPVQKSTEETDCPYCQEMEEDENCPYCEEAEANEESDECPYCQDADRKDSEDECPFCNDVANEECGQDSEMPGSDHSVEITAGPTVKEPTTTSGEDYEGVSLNPPGMDKPNPEEEPREGIASPAISEVDDQNNTPSNRALDIKNGTPFEHVEENPDDAEGSTTEEILQQLDADGTESSPEDQGVVEDVDAADLPVGDNAEENVSRPEDFEDDVPGDMGLAEEEQDPDFGGLIQEDLDAHADNIQKEKVIGMVSEALEGFKQCKPILEKAKEQAPQLYQSSLAMLKAMIEMAKMMGLSDGSESAEEAMGEDSDELAPEENIPEEAAPEENPQEEETHDWKQPFKPHPAHGQTASQEDADEDPKLRSQ